MRGTITPMRLMMNIKAISPELSEEKWLDKDSDTPECVITDFGWLAVGDSVKAGYTYYLSDDTSFTNPIRSVRCLFLKLQAFLQTAQRYLIIQGAMKRKHSILETFITITAMKRTAIL